MSEPAFPPLLSGFAVTGRDPFQAACRAAGEGCDAGLVAYSITDGRLQAALVLAPEVALAQAMAMLPLCGAAFQNALGALSPPEVAVHLAWDGGILVNGARCGRLRAAASTQDPAAQPDWLVAGLDLALLPESGETGHMPDRTALYAEGCGDVAAPALLESWARHTLHWIARWEDEGPAPLHAEWRGLAHGIGGAFEHGGQSGTFLGIDEDFGLLLRQGETTRLIPLTTLLETP